MTVGGAEDAGFAVLMGPDHRVLFAVACALAGGQCGDAGELLLHDVKLVLRRFPILRHALENGVLHELFHGVVRLMIMALAGTTKEIAQVIKLRRAVSVHRAMDHHCRHAGFVHLGDALHVRLVVGVGETLVVYHHVKALGPVGVLVQQYHRPRPLAAFIDAVSYTHLTLPTSALV